MTSPLDNLCGPGKNLAREAPDDQEYAGLIDDGLRKLNDSRNPDLFLGSRFDLAYNAAFSLSLAALRRLGYRPVNKRFMGQQTIYCFSGPAAYIEAGTGSLEGTG